MKFLAAYTLLALSGKKDISTPSSMQPPPTSRVSLARATSPAMTPTSTDSSNPSRARRSTNSLLKAPPKSETPQLPSLPAQHPLARRTTSLPTSLLTSLLASPKPPRRWLPHQLLKKKTTSWEEVSSAMIEQVDPSPLI